MSKIKKISESVGISDIKKLRVSANLSDGLIDSPLRVFWEIFYEKIIEIRAHT